MATQQSKLSSELSSEIPLEKRILQPPRIGKKKVILLAGPTACGKTTLSLLLARALGGEVISADSMQVYRGMDIGTAKVSEEERSRVPHYLIDIRYIQEPFNVVDFYYEAKAAIDSTLARGRVPLVVGGSGFYFRSLIYGPPLGPPPIHELRMKLEEEMKRVGCEALFNRLEALDPDYAKSITAGDRQKIVRALEILTVTGRKVSDLIWQRETVKNEYDFLAWFLHRPRDLLYKLIESRCESMLERGLIDEVKELDKRGLRFNSSASQAIGYRQVLDFLDGPQDQASYLHFVEKFKTQSRHYAKKQFTWFRKEPLFRWLDVELHDFEIAADMIRQDYQNRV